MAILVNGGHSVPAQRPGIRRYMKMAYTQFISFPTWVCPFSPSYRTCTPCKFFLGQVCQSRPGIQGLKAECGANFRTLHRRSHMLYSLMQIQSRLGGGLCILKACQAMVSICRALLPSLHVERPLLKRFTVHQINSRMV